MSGGDPWREAGGAWEPLVTLLDRVERDLGISPAEAASKLRQGLESYDIRAEVMAWQSVCGIDDSGLVWSDGGDLRPTDKGWRNLDWNTGTLSRHSVRVLWLHVEQALAAIRPNPSIAVAAIEPEPWRVRAGEAQSNWILRPEARAEAERRRQKPTVAATARAYEAMATPERNWQALSIEAAMRSSKQFSELKTKEKS